MEKILYFQKTEDFLKYFDFTKSDGFERVTKLIDTKVGFSVQKKYPNNFRFYSPKYKDGSDDIVAIIHVIYKHPDESIENIESKKAPIFLTIYPFSRYRSKYFNYNFSDPNCPTEESLERSKKTLTPIDLEDLDEYYFDHEKMNFFNSKNQQKSGNEVLEEIYNKHCDTVHLLKGFKFRFKIQTRSIIVSILKMKIDFLIKILKHGFGRTLDERKNYSSLLSSFRRSDLKKLTTDSLHNYCSVSTPTFLLKSEISSPCDGNNQFTRT